VVFSREQLLATVWGYEAALDAGTSTVTVHVRRVRRRSKRTLSSQVHHDRLGRRYRFEP